MRKLIIFIAILAYSVNGIAQEKGEINWMTVEEAIAAQEEEPRKIMMDMYTTWCGPCKMLDRNTFQNKDVADYVNENYYAVKFNAEGGGTVNFKDKEYGNPGYDASKKGRNSQHQFAQYLRVQAYPTIVFLDEKADLLAPIKGYHTPNQLEIFLKLFATDKHKEVTTKEQWEAYQKEFKAEFKAE
ncbi:thioredoxin fold domain-containing protein [Aureibaculum sp. 2210JD6-5]|uniref:thioredoxin family protein n=1 Tax=Aureibaculum sp. 2210JD6-5 TaxID=3103957 RepID=UPI002AACC156|nr:thioredoxin fold domain-containing protein [Aureibaculum sp. 2210JD6-5]MDY7396177.1 thioredoxin fold domain-containing protein [Aureibaculum sp. 2210JD6-5]